MLLFNGDNGMKITWKGKFQNIICYCLTTCGDIGLAEELLFQNIICYCLTNTGKNAKSLLKNFKTSYVIV